MFPPPRLENDAANRWTGRADIGYLAGFKSDFLAGRVTINLDGRKKREPRCRAAGPPNRWVHAPERLPKPFMTKIKVRWQAFAC